MLSASSATLVLKMAPVLREYDPPLDAGVLSAVAISVAAEDGSFTHDDERIARLLIAEVGLDAAVQRARDYLPDDPAADLLAEYRAMWEADPWQEPDLQDFMARAAEHGPFVKGFLYGAIGVYMEYAPTPNYTLGQRDRIREQSNRAVAKVLAERMIEQQALEGLPDPEA